METFTRISPLGLSKLNNAEFQNHIARYRRLFITESESPDEVLTLYSSTMMGVSGEQLAELDKELILMTDIVNESRINDETAEMEKVNINRSDYTSLLLQIIMKTRRSPDSEKKSSAVKLYNKVKPYYGFYRYANQQRTALIKGLLVDLAIEEYISCINVLGLQDLINSIERENTLYITLSSNRTFKRANCMKDNSQAIRKRIHIIYKNLSDLVYAESIKNPSSYTIKFIDNLNQLISETSASYNQRIALIRMNQEKKKLMGIIDTATKKDA